jgi:hypothetical protein
MVSVEHPEPPDVVDRLLWRDAQAMIARHPEPDRDGRCVWCEAPWPCEPRRLAERADEVSRRPWRDPRSTGHDLNGLRALPRTRAGLDGDRPGTDPAGAAWPARHPVTDHGFPDQLQSSGRYPAA